MDTGPKQNLGIRTRREFDTLGAEFALRATLPDGRQVDAVLSGGAEDVRLVVP